MAMAKAHYALVFAGAGIALGLLAYKLKNGSSSKTVTYVDHRKHTDEELDRAGLSNRVLRKAETVIQGRTSRIILVVERCTDDHNYSAIIRTAEALGIQHVWLVDPVVTLEDTQGKVGTSAHVTNEASEMYSDDEDSEITFDSNDARVRYEHGKFAKRATEWITVREFKTSKECMEALRKDRRTIWATDLSQQACRLTEHDLPYVNHEGGVIPERLAIVFGTESVGVTEEILQSCDLRVYLPLRGFADSLNLSVAAALIIQQIFHLDPSMIGSMTENEKQELRTKWYPKMVASRAGSGAVTKELRKVDRALRDIDCIKNKAITSVGKESVDGNKNKYVLSKQQKEKLMNEEKLLTRQKELNDKIWKESEDAVADAIRNPPKPLTDVRRCDEHRTAFVGPNVRKQNEAHWKGMAATANSAGEKNINTVPQVQKIKS